MIFAAPVEDLLHALEAARLPGVADELRSFLEDGGLFVYSPSAIMRPA